jgi:hypothetical protein
MSATTLIEATVRGTSCGKVKNKTVLNYAYQTLITHGTKGCYIISDDTETVYWYRGI